MKKSPAYNSDILLSLKKAKINEMPFAHTQMHNYFEIALAQKLGKEWPTKGFNHSSSSKDHYELWDRTIVDKGNIVNLDGLSNEWKKVIESFLLPEYKSIVEKHIQKPMDNCQLKIRLCEYHGDCWMLPHTDRVDRISSQIIYLTEKWEKEWGGNLLILGSPNEKDILKTVVPEFNSSFLFERSDHSWHSVQRTIQELEIVRKTILVQFITL